MILVNNFENDVLLKYLLTIIFTNDGGTFKASGIIMDAKLCLVSRSNILNQSISKIVNSPGSSRTIVRFLYALSGSRLKFEIEFLLNITEIHYL